MTPPLATVPLTEIEPRKPRQSPRMTVAEVSDALRLSEEIVYSMLRSGVIPAANVGRGKRAYWFIPRAAFHSWLTGYQPTVAKVDVQ